MGDGRCKCESWMVTAVAGMKANGKQHIVSRFFSFEPLAIFENPENKKTARCYVAHCFCGVSEIRLDVDNVEVVKFVYLFMYQFCIFHIPFFCVPKNPCCGFDSFFLSLFPNDC